MEGFGSWGVDDGRAAGEWGGRRGWEGGRWLRCGELGVRVQGRRCCVGEWYVGGDTGHKGYLISRFVYRRYKLKSLATWPKGTQKSGF